MITSNKKNIFKREKGITLIALVITIIVLLILAGVSIAMLTGDNGILTQATEAKKANIVGAEKERINLAMQSLKMKKQADNVSTIVTPDELQNQLKADGAKDATVESGENNKLIVTYQESKNKYAVNQDGKVDENGGNPGTGEGGNNNLPSTEDTKPFLPDGAEVIEDDLEKGVVIKDSNGNEWTWIEVPKSIYTNTTYNGGTAPTSSTDYAKIESTMQNYAKDYRENGYTDEWYSEAQHGFASAEEYNNHKNTMLKSVYENGGFYIGRYEAGVTNESASSVIVLKEGRHLYNYTTCKESQERAIELATGGRTSSLMFGIQWDLVLKHIENKKGKTQAELKDDSTAWGNYYYTTFEITKGKYSTDGGGSFTEVNGRYTKEPNNRVLLSTGATERNSTLNIYDLAGNVSEFTLEGDKGEQNNCVIRGGDFAIFRRVSTRSSDYITQRINNNGFRPALW